MAQEGDFHKKRYDGPEAISVQEMPRREFLRTMLAGGITAGVFSMIRTKRSWAVEVKEGMSWKEGIRALRNAVFKPHANEEFALFLKRKDGKDRWHMPKEGERNGIQVSHDELREVMQALHNEELEGIIDAHTHPIDVMLTSDGRASMSEEDVRAMRAGTKPMISIPPSKTDITDIIDGGKLRLSVKVGKEQEQEGASDFLTKSMVADPRGVWFYQPITDKNDSFAKEYRNAARIVKNDINSQIKIVRSKIEKFSHTELDDILRIIAQKRGQVLDVSRLSLQTRVSKMADILTAISHELNEGEKEIVQKILTAEEMQTRHASGFAELLLLRRELNFLETRVKFIEKSHKNPLIQDDYSNLIKAYRGVGVSLQFIPYQDLDL